MRAVVDTSVWVSAILNPSGPPAQVLEALEDGQFSLVASEPLLAELAEVIARGRLVRRYNLTTETTAPVLRVLRDSEFTAVTGSVRICRDPDDDMVIETAINGRACFRMKVRSGVTTRRTALETPQPSVSTRAGPGPIQPRARKRSGAFSAVNSSMKTIYSQPRWKRIS